MTEHFENIVVLGDKNGNFNDIEKVKSDISEAFFRKYFGNRLSILKKASFNILESYIPYYENLSKEFPEDRKDSPLVLLKRKHVSFQWDRNVDPVIHLYDDRMKILYFDGQWEIAEQVYEDCKEKILDEGWEIFRRVKHYFLTGKLIDEAI